MSARTEGCLTTCIMMTVFIVLSLSRHENGGLLPQGLGIALTNTDSGK